MSYSEPTQSQLKRPPESLHENRPSVPLLVLTLTGAAICFFLARPFFSALAWSIALAVVLNPLYHWLLRRLGSRSVSAGLVVVVVTLVLGGVATAILPGLLQAALDGFETLRQQLESGNAAQFLGQHPWLQSGWEWFEAKADLPQVAQQAASYITSLGSSVVQGSLLGLLEVLVTLFFLFYFLRDQESVTARVLALLPLSSSETRQFLSWQIDTLYATLLGTVLVGIIQGLLGGLMFWWLGLNAPVFWGIIMGILCMLPVVGPSLVWAPAAVLLALGGHWLKALLLAGWGTIIIGLIGNLIYPILLGHRLHLHTVAVFIAMVGGLFLFGFCGFFVGPVILAATVSLVSIWQNRNGRAATLTTNERSAL